MADDDKKWSTGKIVGAVVSGFAAAALILWGVPYYLSYEVRAAVKQELADAAIPDDVGRNRGDLEAMRSQLATLTAQVQSMNELVSTLDGKMERRDQALMEYLELQARGDD